MAGRNPAQGSGATFDFRPICVALAFILATAPIPSCPAPSGLAISHQEGILPAKARDFRHRNCGDQYKLDVNKLNVIVPEK
jgi:hypothetical protein